MKYQNIKDNHGYNKNRGKHNTYNGKQNSSKKAVYAEDKSMDRRSKYKRSTYQETVYGGSRFNRTKRHRMNNRSRYRKTASFDVVSLINKPEQAESLGLKTNVTFSQLGLDERICKLLEIKGFNQATPIQADVIPKLLQGRSILGIAPTGTGKTAFFITCYSSITCKTD